MLLHERRETTLAGVASRHCKTVRSHVDARERVIHVLSENHIPKVRPMQYDADTAHGRAKALPKICDFCMKRQRPPGGDLSLQRILEGDISEVCWKPSSLTFTPRDDHSCDDTG